VISGIPQGSILGPLLFTIFINDLPECVNSYCKLFADDTKLYNITSNSCTLQQDIDSLQEWTDTWDLHFNVEKCKVLHLGRQNPECKYYMKVNGEDKQILISEEERDLGVTFDKSLSFDPHIQNSINKANKMIGIIKRTFSYLDKDIFGKLYKAMVRPYLEYANTVWYPALKRQSIIIEKVQRRATKLVKDCYCMSYEERLKYLGLHSLYGRRVRGDLIQTYRMYNGIDDVKWTDFLNMHLHKQHETPRGRFL